MPMNVREPAGERNLPLPVRIGGSNECEVRVPGASGVASVCFEWYDDALRLRIDGDSAIRVNGSWMAPGAFREPRVGDVLFVGDARIRLLATGPQAALIVEHQAGNDTIEPVRVSAELNGEEFGDEEILPAEIDVLSEIDHNLSLGRSKASRLGWILAGVAVLSMVALAFAVKRVELDVDPVDARVRASGGSWHSATALFALPGEHIVTARREGYVPYRATHRIGVENEPPLRIRLLPLPGRLAIDTQGVAAQVFVDGALAGSAPGEIAIGAGVRTIVLRAPRHLDATRRIVVKGAGARESLRVSLKNHWGTLLVSAATADATLKVDDHAQWPLPATIDLPAGLHRLSIRATSARPWQGAVLVKAGETLTVGPVTLGAPDATLHLDSEPRGADVTAAGVFRGRTPLAISLTAGLPQDFTVARAGYATVTRRITPAAAQRIVLKLELPMVPVRLALQGKPSEADVMIDGVFRGKTPGIFELPATRHALEISSAGHQSFKTEVDLTAAVARAIDYDLTPEGRPAGWKPPAATLEAPSGMSLRLLPLGTFVLGSERREQGRRANEYSRTVMFERPVYIATREITNAQFRAFRPTHASGFIDKRSIDLDAMPVTGVTWLDAVQYCNWLSEREGLTPAYEQRDGKWALRQPVTHGYRLPTESEWELAARYGGAERKLRRYEWGDSLPPPSQNANLAGDEAVTSLASVLEGWRDEYASIAPVGKFAPNMLGLHDLVGNVAEWVNDVYVSLDASAATKDYLGPASMGSRHVIKGSSWRTATFADLRAAWREGGEAASQDLGFRVARYAE